MREAGIGKRDGDRSVSASMLLGQQTAEQRGCKPFRYFLHTLVSRTLHLYMPRFALWFAKFGLLKLGTFLVVLI